jgi:hypothetical protein
MDHASAIESLSDWVDGRLATAQAADVERHVQQCEECRGVADTLRSVRREIDAHGAALFTAHPEADALSRFALDRDRLELPALAAIGAHVRACPSCAAECAWMRRAASPSPLDRLVAWVVGHRTPGAWLRPAVTVLAAIVLLPAAYRGVIELPRAREEARRAATLRPIVPPPSAWSGGGVDPLVLSTPLRGAAPAAELRLRAGQPAQPVFVAVEPPEGASRIAAVLRDSTGTAVWRWEGPLEESWSGPARVFAFLVPAARLAPGDQAFELSAGGGATPFFAGRFRVVGATR